MIHSYEPPRQPLFWAAIAFSVGLWTGLRAWRPASWWVLAATAFVFSAAWFIANRAWLGKILALATWFLLGAFLIQIRGQPQTDARILNLADGQEVTLTAGDSRGIFAHRRAGDS